MHSRRPSRPKALRRLLTTPLLVQSKLLRRRNYRAAAIGDNRGRASSATAQFMFDTAKKLVDDTKSKAPRD